MPWNWAQESLLRVNYILLILYVIHDILLKLFLWFSCSCAVLTSYSQLSCDDWFQHLHLLVIPTWTAMFGFLHGQRCFDSYMDSNMRILTWTAMFDSDIDSNIWIPSWTATFWFLHGQQRLIPSWKATFGFLHGQQHLDSYMDSNMRIFYMNSNIWFRHWQCLKTMDTIGNCQRLAFTVGCISTYA